MRRLLIIVPLLAFIACSESEAPASTGQDIKSYGFGRNGTPDDIWDAQDVSDVGVVDQDTASPVDTAIPDIGPPDAGVPDTALPDTGPEDVGTPDTGAPDTGAAPDITDAGPTCGNGLLDPGESCEKAIPGSCPTSCIDPPGCTATVLEGSADECSAKCVTLFVTDLIDDDDCCPPAGTAETDTDCNLCGNGSLDIGESCDDSSNSPCPTECPPPSGCQTWALSGDSATCSATCEPVTTTVTAGGDGCCPDGATEEDDSDCVVICGDGVLGPGETCEPELPLSTTCAALGYAGGTPSCLPDCTLSTLTCTGGHLLIYEKISNIFLVGDIRSVAWHGSGEWALLVGAGGDLARYDAESGALSLLPALDGAPVDVGESVDGQSILIAGQDDDSAALWEVTEGELGEVVVTPIAVDLLGSEATCVVPQPTGGEWAICTRVKNTSGYINYLYRYSESEGVLGFKAYAAGAGISDAMWSDTAYPGSDALITSEGQNGAGSQSWVLASNLVVANGWSPGFGNAGRAGWRPGGDYGVVLGTSTNKLYVFDGAWQSHSTPAPNNGARGNAIAWRPDGSRALVVARPTGLPLEGSVFDHRPGGTVGYNQSAWVNVSIPGYADSPYNGSTSASLLDVSWRPGSACDEGLIVGGDNGTTFNPTFGLVVRFYDQDDPDCP